MFNVRKLDIITGVVTNLPDITGGGQRTITSGTTADISILVTPAGAAQPVAGRQRRLGPEHPRTATAALHGIINDDGLPVPPVP